MDNQTLKDASKKLSYMTLAFSFYHFALYAVEEDSLILIAAVVLLIFAVLEFFVSETY
jgi:hypothetical protein